MRLVGPACNNGGSADAVRAETVPAFAGHCAGRLSAESVAVRRCCGHLHTLISTVKIQTDLIHTGNQNNFLRSEEHSSHTVAGAVDIDQETVCCYGIAACKIGIAGKYLGPEGILLFLGLRLFAVQIGKVLSLNLECVHQTNLRQGNRTAV